MRRWLLVLALGVAGCSSKEFFPLDEGLSGSYRLRTSRKESISLKRKRVLSVAGHRGIEIEGPTSVTRFAWEGGTLIGDQLANGFAHPPLPFLDVNLEKDKERSWEGTLSVLGRIEPAHATLTQVQRSDVYRGTLTKIIEATLTVETKTRQFEVVSRFGQGVGLLSQHHRTNGAFDYELTRQ